MSGRVPDKDARGGTRLEFVGCVWAKPRIVETSKASKFGVVRECAKEFEIW